MDREEVSLVVSYVKDAMPTLSRFLIFPFVT